MLLSTTNIVFTGIILLSVVVIYYFTKSRKPPFPPGPKPSFVIGNLRDLPILKPWETFHRWGGEYGDIVYLSTFKDSLIVLNSYEAISELLENRSTIYSDRRHAFMVDELMGFGGTTVDLPYGAIWRKHRKIYNKELNAFAVSKLEAHQYEACMELLLHLLETPERFSKHIEMFTAQVVMGIGYDHKISSEDDELFNLNLKTTRAFAKASQPGYFLVDTFPWLGLLPSWLPGMTFKKFGEETSQRVYQVREIPFRQVKERMALGTARPCLVTNVLSEMAEKRMEDPEDLLVLKEVAMALFGAGTITTDDTLHAFILSMILHPDVQTKAQYEIDTVLHGSRLPMLADRPSMPYITALTKELLRWFPATPVAFPHITSEDDVYKGYYIPKGSIVIPNAWSVLRDPTIYDKPFEFLPERFLPDKNGEVAKDPAVVGAFGYGRRICPGRFLAERTIWLAIASMLAVFKLDYAVDENGDRNDVLQAFDVAPGIVNHLKPFRCSIKPRSVQHEKLIRLNQPDRTNI